MLPGLFKERWRNGSRAAASCGLKVRLWRRAQFCLGQSDFIFADGAWDVCEGDHSLDVMNRWDALSMRIRCRRFGESRPSLRDRTGQPRSSTLHETRGGVPGTPALINPLNPITLRSRLNTCQNCAAARYHRDAKGRGDAPPRVSANGAPTTAIVSPSRPPIARNTW